MGVIGWFARRGDEDDMEKRLHERLTGLEKAVEKLIEKPAGNTITIENLHVHNPALEQLTFRLDRLDIDELSGALNLGNNFGTRVGRKEPQAGQQPGPKPEDKQQRFEMKRTAAGFKYETGTKPGR